MYIIYYSYINIKLFWKLCYCFIICLLYRLSLYIIDKLYKPFDRFDKSNRLVFSSYLQEMEDYQMVEADKEYKNDKMVEPKYKKEDYTVPYKTSPLKEAIKKEIVSILNENDEDKEPTRAQIKGIDKSIGDAKEALARAVAKVKELGPDIKKLAKETNDKIKKNPAGKADYLKVYMTNPDVKEFIKLRKMLKSADLL